MKYEIGVKINGRFRGAVDEERLRGFAGRVLAAEDVASAEIGIVVTGDAVVRALNRQFCGEDAPTDVLSFALTEGKDDFALPPGDALRLGEVVISLPAARRQAKRAGHSLEREVALLLVHGLLHLLGYDHGVESDERRMRSRQEALLASLGVI
ncbi:MAG: rRNA maturation RNase YbeY [Dehalococcoidia bacterium]|jgi:probable rRNA maturation factor